MPNFLRRKSKSFKGSPKSGAASQKPSTVASVESMAPDYSKGTPVGIGAWELHRNVPLMKTYFFNPTTEQSMWGLPMKYCLELPGIEGPDGDDDWMVFVDFASNRKFFTSEKRSRVQWKPPMIYKGVVKQIEFFSPSWVPELETRKPKESTVGELPGKKEDKENFAFSVGAGSRASIPQLPKDQRRPTLESVLKTVTVDQILDDSTACAGFHRFLVASHAEENLLFWGACEVFAKGEWKGMKVLGVEEHTPEVEDDEATMELQMQMTSTRVSKRLGNALPRKLTASEEAQMIYNKFLKTGAELWVCVDMKDEKEIAKAIAEGDPSVDDRTVFLRAQTSVLRNLQADLHQRFLRAVLSDNKLKIQTGEEFQSDEVLRFAIRRLGMARRLSF